MEPFIGQIMMFGGNFAPRGWALCQGQLLSISSNSALFSILGTTYGGDGKSTFALPDLRGRFPMQQGSGPGLSNHSLGQKGGAESVNLTVNQLPSHSHTMAGSSDPATARNPQGGFPASPAVDGTRTGVESYAAAANVNLNDAVIGDSGGGQAVPITPPFLAINFCIALVGLYPSRN